MGDVKPGFRLLAAVGAGAALLAGCASTTETELAAAADAAAVDPGCAPSGALAYLCGVMNAEDIVPIGASKWLLASSLGPLGGEAGPGKIYLIDSETMTAEELFPGSAPAMRHDAAMYPDCPSIDLQSFDTHGLAVREASPGIYRLYSTSHGAMEAIQAWDLDATGEKPTATWVGCVPLPQQSAMFNSVAILADGGFVTTLFMDRSDPQAFAAINRGEINGAVYEWRPGGEVTAIPGTELSGPNGIELSADDRYMFVAAFGGRSVHRFDRGPNPSAPASAAVDVTPDNLRWTETGTLLTVGNNTTPETGWTVYEIDPSAMTATRVAGVDQSATLQGAATALQVGDLIWIGTFSGDRVGFFRAR